MQFFYEGIFADSGRQFALVDVQPQFADLTYKTLSPESKLLLDDSIIHATIIKQDEPSDDESSVYNVFERLNTGATRLTAQEIRASIHHGPFSDLLSTLNEAEAWRATFFKPLQPRMRDQELILRFFALYFKRDKYQRPMEVFLNDFMGANRNLRRYPADRLRQAFVPTVEVILEQIGPTAFKPQGPFNAAVFDSVMIAVASRLESGQTSNVQCLRDQWERLVKEKDYLDSTLKATADPTSVQNRIGLALQAFGS